MGGDFFQGAGGGEVASHAGVFRGASFVGRDEKRACVGGWGGGGVDLILSLCEGGWN